MSRQTTYARQKPRIGQVTAQPEPNRVYLTITDFLDKEKPLTLAKMLSCRDSTKVSKSVPYLQGFVKIKNAPLSKEVGV